MTNPPYVSTTVYAAAAGLSERAVRDRIDRGEIEATQTATGAPWRIPWAAYQEVAGEAAGEAVAAPVGRERPKKERRGMAYIRWVKTCLFIIVAFVCRYFAENFMTINFWSLKSLLVTLASTIVGGTGYAIWKYVDPDGKW
jgi:hypothetical protein